MGHDDDLPHCLSPGPSYPEDERPAGFTTRAWIVMVGDLGEADVDRIAARREQGWRGPRPRADYAEILNRAWAGP
jgi:hypothetical protein